jgi:cold shock CspA family protein
MAGSHFPDHWCDSKENRGYSIVVVVRAQMRIVKYAPKKLYGFAEDENGQVFFHIRSFSWGDGVSRRYPPPIVGETVEVLYDPSERVQNKAPRARNVTRISEPVPSVGVVESFDSDRGYGFIHSEDGRSHYLHRSEMADQDRTPVIGSEVVFFEGYRQGRLRACYIRTVDQ